jgi:hypothetical protein
MHEALHIAVVLSLEQQLLFALERRVKHGLSLGAHIPILCRKNDLLTRSATVMRCHEDGKCALTSQLSSSSWTVEGCARSAVSSTASVFVCSSTSLCPALAARARRSSATGSKVSLGWKPFCREAEEIHDGDQCLFSGSLCQYYHSPGGR